MQDSNSWGPGLETHVQTMDGWRENMRTNKPKSSKTNLPNWNIVKYARKLRKTEKLIKFKNTLSKLSVVAHTN